MVQVGLVRCHWVADDPAYIDYHDHEWGVPVHDDRLLFEFLILEGAQAGLSWRTILAKREHYRAVYDNFDLHRVSRYSAGKIDKLLSDTGIVRNRAKVAASVQNARAFQQVQQEFGSFDTYLWSFVAGKVKQNRWCSTTKLPAQTPESQALSKDLCKRGFKFVGPTICYAFMQAVGLVNDHSMDCFRYAELGGQSTKKGGRVAPKS